MFQSYQVEMNRLKKYLPEQYETKKLYDSNYCFKLWDKYIHENFKKTKSQEFYRGWVEDIGPYSVAVNIHDQFRRIELYRRIREFVDPKLSLMDIGCGSASLYWDYLENMETYLIDLPNMNQEYVKFKSKNYNNKYVGEINIVPNGKKFDYIFVIDVLEHLEDPSHFFIENVDKYLKSGGYVFVQAPWGGIPEHLEISPINWQKNGKSFLKDNYKLVKPINSILHLSGYYLSGIYKKISLCKI